MRFIAKSEKIPAKLSSKVGTNFPSKRNQDSETFEISQDLDLCRFLSSNFVQDNQRKCNLFSSLALTFTPKHFTLIVVRMTQPSIAVTFSVQTRFSVRYDIINWTLQHKTKFLNNVEVVQFWFLAVCCFSCDTQETACFHSTQGRFSCLLTCPVNPSQNSGMSHSPWAALHRCVSGRTYKTRKFPSWY